MKIGLLKVLILIILVGTTFSIVDKLLPFYWGNRMLLSKMEVLDNRKEINTLFIGGSTVFRQIDPIIFDTLTIEETNSFNLGTDGCYPTQCYYLTKEIISSDFGENIKTIFISLNSFDPIPKGRNGTTRIKYFSTLPVFINRLNFIIDKEQESTEFKKNFIKYFTATYEGFFKIGMRKDIIQYIIGQASFGSGYFGSSQSGYVALSGQHTSNNKIKANIQNATARIKKGWEKSYKTNPTDSHNHAHLKIINDLIDFCEDNNVNIIFILPPQHFILESIDEIHSLYSHIPAKNKIAANHPDTYPDLYNPSNKWDAGHLNDSGAKVYTKIIADAYNEL